LEFFGFFRADKPPFSIPGLTLDAVTGRNRHSTDPHR